MATLASVMEELKAKGSEKAAALYVKHGIPAGRSYGVSVATLKGIAKTIKGNQALAMELYATGKMDAMYLAGMVAAGAKMSRKELEAWAEGGKELPMIAEYTVPWVTVENAAGRELAMQWIAAKDDGLKAVGWRTYAGLVTVMEDASLDLKEVEGCWRRW